jgi:simple sugar transport system permease protein
MLEFAARSLNAATVLAIAALGELIGQRAGILNVGVEGVMLFGATLGFIVAKTSESYLLGLLAAVIVGGLVAALHGFFSITLRGNQVVNGMGIWILGFGLTAYIGYPYSGPLGMERIPDLAGVSPFFFLAVVLVILTWWVLTRTTLGLRLRSAGESPSVTEVSGINVSRTRYLAVVVGGMLMGLAGAIYSLDYNPVWSVNFLLGWGFTALALVFFSLWNPFILFGGSILFGALWQLSLNPELVLPGVMSRYLWRTVPFVITIGVLVAMSTKWFSSRWGAARPEALGQPYERE